MKREFESLRLMTEYSAVRAGFLAVVSSSCSEEENKWLFSKLKGREETLRAHPAWKDYEAKHPEVKEPASSFHQGRGETGTKEWQVTLEKPVGSNFGFQINNEDSKALFVERLY